MSKIKKADAQINIKQLLRRCLGHNKCKLIPPYHDASSNCRRDGVIAKLRDTFLKIAKEYKAIGRVMRLLST